MGLINKFKKYRTDQKQKAKKPKAEESASEEPEGDMSFLDHIEELRWHLIRSFIAIGLVAIAVFIFRQWVTDNIFLAPFQPDFPMHRFLCSINDALCFEKIEVMYIAYGPFDQFLKAIGMGFIGGFVVAFPYILWEMWRFLKPGLHQNEKNRLRGGVFILSLLFFIGILFAYYIITPFSVTFLANFKLAESVENQWRIGKIISMISQITIAGGLMFELPVLVYVLSKLGLVTPEAMKKYRKHAVVVLLIMAAILTPPDILSQVLIFIPLIGLYQISIGISRAVNKKRDKELMGEERPEAKSEKTEASAKNKDTSVDNTSAESKAPGNDDIAKDENANGNGTPPKDGPPD
ncbi:twin-arginine translocase subunit TatC [bacterium]|nr:twin-arginine translocase subunit TatC [bacterium]